MRSDDKTDDQYHDHMRRLDAIRRAWQRGEITTRQKRRQFADENKQYYETDTKSENTGEKITRVPRHNDAMAALLADSTGADIEAVEIAVARRRELSAAAANAETLGEARELAQQARDAYASVMAAAMPRRRAS